MVRDRLSDWKMMTTEMIVALSLRATRLAAWDIRMVRDRLSDWKMMTTEMMNCRQRMVGLVSIARN